MFHLLQASRHSVKGMHISYTENKAFLLTGGTDMRLRYWDVTSPVESFIVANAATDPTNNATTSYK